MEKLSEYLKKGAKLSSETCPVCGQLLVKLNDKLYCVKCEREIIFAESRDEYVKLYSQLTLVRLKELLTKRIDEIRERLEKMPDDTSLLPVLEKYLFLLEKINGILSK